MAVTKRGIYHNLNESKYATSNNEVVFFFSSNVYLDRFLDGYVEHRIVFRDKIAKAMKVEGMNTAFLADIHFYKDIEKRGFRCHVVHQNDFTMSGGYLNSRGESEWRELHLFALRKLTGKNTLEWLKIPEQK